MRSRSRRLFIVLIHVIGVSNHLPAHPVVGSIVLEPLDLRNTEKGGQLSLRQQQQHDDDDEILKEPYWLQVRTCTLFSIDTNPLSFYTFL